MQGRPRRTEARSRATLALGTAAIALLSVSAAAAGAPNHVRDVKLRAAPGPADAVEIEVVGTGTPSYSARVADNGLRLVVDLAGTDVSGAPEAIAKPLGVVGGVLTQSFRTPTGPVTRVSVSLAQPATYRVRPDGTVLRILLAPAANGSTPALASPGAKAKAGAAPALRDVRFERVGAGKSGCSGTCDRVVIATGAAPTYDRVTSPQGHPRLVLRGVRAPEALARTLDVSAYGGPLRAVSTFYDAGLDATIVEVTGASDDAGVVVVEGKELHWTFEVRGAKAVDKKGDPLPRRVTTVAREDLGPAPPPATTQYRPDSAVVEETGSAQAAGVTATVAAQVGGGNGRYVGRRIDLDLKDADIHNILRLLADVGRVNIVTTDDVRGEVTIRMRNVPWDQALDVVLQAKGLGMVQQGNLIRVAPMATLQKERELKLAAAKQEFELTPLETRLINVSYARAEEVAPRARELLSPRGSISVDARTNVLIARDIASNLNYVEQLVRSLDTQTPLVLVEARIVEATSRYLRDLGIQWGGDATFSDATGNPTGLAFPSRFSVAGGASDGQTPTAGVSPFNRVVPNPNFAVNLPAVSGTGQGGALGLSFGSVDNNFNLNVRLTAAEASGMVRIVSSPRILTLDNQEARIKQGTLIPFSQVSAQGVQTTFQEASLQLLVKPHVTADGSVSMRVKINRNEPDFNQTSARGDPTILQREAETDLLVMDGHTAVIGGIYSRNTGRNLDQVPFFGDIPILGVLFQRRRASDLRGELVIFITPRIVNRAEALGR